MNWKWTDRILIQLIERNISKDIIETALGSPDKVVTGRKNRKIFQKVIKNKLVTVVTEGESLITVYLTDKIKKYTGGD